MFGISESTAGQHSHTALRKLLTTVLAAKREQSAPQDERDGRSEPGANHSHTALRG